MSNAVPRSPRLRAPQPALGHGGRRWSHAVVLALACLLGVPIGHPARAAEVPGPASTVDTPENLEFFENSIRPIFVEHCHACHSAGAEKLKGDLRLDSKAGWQRGGASGKPVVVPGNPNASLLIQAVRHADPDLAMPPKEKLAPEKIAALESWIARGAPDPRTGGVPLPDPREAARQHWAFQPIRKPTPPAVHDQAWVRTPIDRFILNPLEARQLRPAPAADRRSLLRRASYLLTGLLPTYSEIAEFEADPAPLAEAFDRVVDRLLASPRYGERWARYWMDIARYADTKGYVFEEERRYPYAYTYRDWLIRAFNDDKPYDRFLVEQIAGDQVATDTDRSPLAAMGFLTLGRRFLNNPHDIIDDRLDVVMRGTMAITFTCARCHDHKYDPIPSEDYYSLYGVFASSEEPAEKPLLGSIPDPVQYAAFQTELARRERERDDFIRDKEQAYRHRLRETVGDHLLAAHDAAALPADRREELARGRQMSPLVVGRWIEAQTRWKAEPHPLFAAWQAFAALPTNTADFAEAARPVAAAIAANADHRHAAVVSRAFAGDPPAFLAAVAQRYNDLFRQTTDAEVQAYLSAKGTPLDLSPGELYTLFDTPDGQRKRALQRRVEEIHALHPGAPPRAMAMVDKATPVEPVVFKRGNPGNPGAKVPRRFPGLLAGPDRQPFQHGSGRLELAQSIASPTNPLTARVIANRVWLQLFGAPLVRTPADFGLRSEPPTHPELLDWLAATLIEHGWSLKYLQRVILASATWQQASSPDSPAVAATDPDNRWLTHQNRRRLDFEGQRDLLLAAAGRLDLTMGGQSAEIAGRDYSPRRTVYGFVERQNLPGVFRTFDFASPDTSSPQRFQTTVPQQALYFLNSPFALDQARGLAGRPDVAGQPNPTARVSRLYEIVLQRPPEPAELDLADRFLADAPEAPTEVDPAPLWQHGHGRFDPATQSVRDFAMLPHFTGSAWQGGPKLPDPVLGWIQLTADGGHPGGNAHGPAIRRWTSPVDGTVEISGTLKHPGEVGDGVRAYVVSSRLGTTGQWSARKTTVETRVASIAVRRGDTVDFVVECGADENTDGFQWAPRVRLIEPMMAGAPAPTWDAKTDFAGPGSNPAPLTRWERYAQVLLMANEAVFVD